MHKMKTNTERPLAALPTLAHRTRLRSVPRTILLAPALLLLTSCATSPAPKTAPQPAAADSAEAIIAAYSEAVGGPAAWSSRKSLKMETTLNLPGMNIGGTATVVMVPDGRFRTDMSLPGIGTMSKGFDGKEVWSSDPINGLRIVTGVEARQSIIESAWAADHRIAELYSEISLVESETAGQKCLELVAPECPPARACFDNETGLMVSLQGEQSSPQGTNPYTATMADYQEVEGARFAHSSSVTTGPVTMEGRVSGVFWDVEVADSFFDRPSSP